MDQVRILALGGLDENGKNMYIVEINDSIFVIEAGLKYPSNSQQLGVEFVIPDFQYLVERKDRVKGIFITHAHDDVMAALPYLLKQIKAPVYTGNFSANRISDLLKKEKIKNMEIHRMKKNSKVTIDGVQIQTFPVIHSLPDAFGLSLMSDAGAIVYTGEFIMDYDKSDGIFDSDISELIGIGKKDVLCLLSESQYADRSGHTAPSHRITKKVESHFEHTEHRIIVSVYSQSLFRVLEVIELAKKYNRKVYIYDKELKEKLKMVAELKYNAMPNNLFVEDVNFQNEMENVVIIVSDSGNRLFLKMSNIASQADDRICFRESDTVIIASPIVSGTEKSASEMENEIYKAGAKILTLSSKEVTSMHPSIEDLKMMLYFFKPKYYIPVKGAYRLLYENANIALDMGYRPDDILLLDNGQVAEFKDGVLTSVAEHHKVEDTMIDGIENFDVTGVVLKDREMLSTDGVIILGIGLNNKTKAIINGPDIQTRGFIYLKNAEHIMEKVVELFVSTITNAVKEKRYNNLEVRAEARDKITKYLMKETGKRPIVLPVILEINE